MSIFSRLVSVSVFIAVAVVLFTSGAYAKTRGSGLFDSKPSSKEKTQEFSDDEIIFEEDESQDSDYTKERKFSDDSASVKMREKDYSLRESDNEEVATEFDQKGYASWYGREFHGRKTASGGKFDMYDMTAAHKTLPFGTVLKVTNLSSGKSVNVVINDRGPYKKNRIIDLSYAAGRELGILAKGEEMVGVSIIKLGNGKTEKNSTQVKAVSGEEEYLIEEDDSDVNADIPEERIVSGNFEIQAGAFYSMKNAEKIKQRIESSVGGKVVITEDGDLYKVKMINVRSKNEAERIMRSLEKDDIKSILLQK
ncbi:MAG TPA: septal ring lytic transglycosylase RlpA family protein [Spirochaetota bacterium]|nr:septal ring lytic transglycosylase RlpA family protein [Spirochaetota bacterium]HOH37274.1 septal ring lytic transglycosylase RlpA family protein [Spirochaetota bacterium]HPJ14483.1 septal ring lytic transglycosylase RlpA family protein [Spirochaetota bacterium]HPM33737.1 septal ring lytic transglycosylase RlpA family protein [Spirochaetota bacterium]HPY03199.1 septal ring lytic transglycosylase RlpA family protein [Spirochaetota bacterium]